MPNYIAAAETALRLIRDAGRVYSVQRSVEADYDPIEGIDPDPQPEDTTIYSLTAVVLPATVARFRGIDNRIVEDNKLVVSRARYLLVAAKSPTDGSNIPEPEPEDRVTIDGSQWKVVGCSPLKPADVPILYRVGVIKDQ